MGLREAQVRELTDQAVRWGQLFLARFQSPFRVSTLDDPVNQMVSQMSSGLVKAQKVALRAAGRADRLEFWLRPSWYERLK